LVSNDLHELLGVCDRIAAMHRGRLVEVRETRQWTPSELLKAIVGESSDSISSISALSGGV
jgi:ribose transport system ATP-binding protein